MMFDEVFDAFAPALNKYLLKSLAHETVLDMKGNLYDAFVLKCVSITNISIEHYMEGVIR